MPRIGLLTDIFHHLKLTTVFFSKKVKPGTVEHLLSFGSHHLMLICISMYLNAFEKETFSAF